MIQLNPIFGIGFGGYPHFVNQYYPLITGYSVVGTAHNIYLEILAETGLVNLMIFGLLFWLLLRSLKKIGRVAAGMEHGEQLTNWTKVLRIGILAHLLAGLTTPNLLATEIYVFMGLTLATKKMFADQISHERLVANPHEKQISIRVAV
jgi:O-antigen ligase